MKVSISLPNEDVEFLDAYAAAAGLGSRSAAVQHAVRLLRASGLGAAYEDAFAAADESGDADAWDAAVADGLGAGAAG